MPIERPAAPPKRASIARQPGKLPVSTGKHAKRQSAVEEIGAIAGMFLIARGQLADAAAIGMHGPGLAEEIVKLGDEVEEVGKGLDYLTQAGPYAGIMRAAIPLLAQIAVNHNRMKPNGMIPGLLPKAALEAQARADLAEMELHALRKQKEAEDKVRQAQTEFQRFETDLAAAPASGSHHAPQEAYS